MKKIIFIAISIITIIPLWWITSKIENEFKHSLVLKWLIKDGFEIGLFRILLLVFIIWFIGRTIKKGEF